MLRIIVESPQRSASASQIKLVANLPAGAELDSGMNFSHVQRSFVVSVICGPQSVSVLCM